MSCDIELEVGAGSARGRFMTRVVDAPSGGEPSASFQLDVDDMLQERDALENTVLASGASGRRVVPAHEQQLRRVGQQLFDALLSGSVLGTYRASLGVAQQRGEPLRVVLRLTARSWPPCRGRRCLTPRSGPTFAVGSRWCGTCPRPTPANRWR